jgi:ectoine hydroxylase
MTLSEEQLASLDEQGFLLIDDVIGTDDVQRLRDRLPALFSDGNEANVVEKNGDVVRTAMGLHQRDSLYAALVRHPSLVGPALQVLGESAYIQQVKVNVKAAFTGDVWQWHYDFATHHGEDGVPAPRALNVHVFLDDVTQFNGPLYFLPGSHKLGQHSAYLDTQTTSYPLWVVTEEVVCNAAASAGIVAATGRRGSLLIFHDTLIHASPNNLSPWDRAIFSLILNPVTNAYTSIQRPEYKHHRDLTPVVALSASCLSDCP